MWLGKWKGIFLTSLSTLVRDNTHMTNFEDPPPPDHLRPKFFHPLDLGRPIFKRTPTPAPPSPTNYESKTVPCMCERTKSKQTKPSYVTFKLTTHSIVRFSPQTVQWYH